MDARLSISLHGVKMGVAGKNGAPSKRSSVGGWSDGSVRRNIDFLRSVDFSNCSGFGLVFTGTVSDCPGSPDDWVRLRGAFFKRLDRMGLLRLHWVTEWQRRGVPHLHGMLFFSTPDPSLPSRIVKAWTELAAVYGSAERGQHIGSVTDALGWAKYMAKHASRGVNHYQRSKESIPSSWHGRTGRIWGHKGDWPIFETGKFRLRREVFFHYRRLLRSWRRADARASGCRFRIRSARSCLKSNTRNAAEVRGMSEWVPFDISTELLYFSNGMVPTDDFVENVVQL